MSLLICCFIIVVLFATPLILYRKLYFKPVSSLFVFREGGNIKCLTFPVLPIRRSFRSLSSGSEYSFVQIASGLFVFYVQRDDDDCHLRFGEVSLGTPVLIFARNRFGRFVSVSLSSRIVLEAVKKFKV